MARFMMFMYPGITPEEYADGPDVDAVEAMGRFNQEMLDAGVLLAADGLRPAEDGFSVTVQDGEKLITDGPFAEAKEVVGGYWILQAKDLEEAKAWARKVPIGPGPRVEVRPIWEMEDFEEELQEAGRLSHEPPAQTKA